MRHKWSRVPLVKVCANPDDIRCGPFGTQLNKREFRAEGVPLWGIKQVNANFAIGTKEFLEARTAKRLKQYDLRAGDIVMTRKGTVGNCAVYPPRFEAGVMHSDLLRLRVNPALCEPEFLVHQLHYSPDVAQQLTLISGGAIMPGINVGRLKQLEVFLPPLPEQKRIAEILDRAEALRAKRRAALAQLDTLTQSIFVDLAGDLVSNSKKWPVIRFEDLCDRVTVGIVVKPASYYVESGVPALRSLNIKPGRIVMNDLVYFSKSNNDTKLAKTKLKTGDVVLVRSGQPGTAAVVPPELDGINAIDLLITTPSPLKCESTFLCYFFNSPHGRAIALSSQRGQVQKHLNVGSLTETPIPLPPLSVQREFTRRLAAVEKLKTAHRKSLAELDALFASLQHRAFRGEL